MTDEPLSDVNYADMADAFLAAIDLRGAGGRLTLDEIDTIMGQYGLDPVPLGNGERQRWNHERRVHRVRVNRFLLRERGATLEVVGHEAGGTPVYWLKAAASKMIGDPFERGITFFRQTKRYFDAIKAIYEKTHQPPPGLSEADLKRWHTLSRRQVERAIQGYFDTLEQAAIGIGVGQLVPDFPEDIVDLREAREKRRRARKGKAA